MKHKDKLVVALLSCFVFGISLAQETYYDGAENATVSPYTKECVGNWTAWSACFPGTVSNPISWEERNYELTPAQKDASACYAAASLFAVETRPCSQPSTDTPVNDLSTVDCTALGLYQCGTGRCIEKDLLCNGDNDCGDNTDEYPTNRSGCVKESPQLICGFEQTTSNNNLPPKGERYLTGIPGIEEFAAGFDLLTGKFKRNVLSMSGHGSCRTVLITGTTDSYYRIPENVAAFRQTEEIVIDPTVIYDSGLAVLNATSDGLKYNIDFGGTVVDVAGTAGLTQSDYIKSQVTRSVANDQLYSYSVISASVNTAKISLNEPQKLEVSNNFISRLMDLPHTTFSFSKYMALVQDFGTHFVSSAKLGGTYTDTEVYSRCWLENDGGYELYSALPWRTNVPDCTRQSFLLRLNPNTALPLSPECQTIENDVTKTMRESAYDVKVAVSGGAIDAASNLKFDFGKTTWDAWVQSITNSPTLNMKNFQLQKISSLVSSDVIKMDSVRKTNVAQFINQAIDIYLQAYDAFNLCEPCQENTNADFAYDYADYNVEPNYGVPYVTGTGQDYKCYCTYDVPLKDETCGGVVFVSSFTSLLLACLLAYWNSFGY